MALEELSLRWCPLKSVKLERMQMWLGFRTGNVAGALSVCPSVSGRLDRSGPGLGLSLIWLRMRLLSLDINANDLIKPVSSVKRAHANVAGVQDGQ